MYVLNENLTFDVIKEYLEHKNDSLNLFIDYNVLDNTLKNIIVNKINVTMGKIIKNKKVSIEELIKSSGYCLFVLRYYPILKIDFQKSIDRYYNVIKERLRVTI